MAKKQNWHFLHNLCIFMVFPCAQQGSMLHTSLSRVHISTSTTGTVKSCFFSWRHSSSSGPLLGGVPTNRLQKEHTVLTLQASGVIFLFFLGSKDSKIKIPGITRFLIHEKCRSQNSSILRLLHCQI